jgi:hypothetical protein
MNLVLLCVTLPLAAGFALLAARWMLSVRLRTPIDQQVVRGGLATGWHVAAWCCTFLLSSAGGLMSFALLVAHTGNRDVFGVFLFACINIAYICLLCFVDRDMHGRVYLVQLCLWVVVVLYALLFMYVLWTFALDDARVSNSTLVGATHFCNAVAIVHALVMDACVWFGGWEKHMDG